MVLQKLKNWGVKQLKKHYTNKAKIRMWDESIPNTTLSKKQKIDRMDKIIKEKVNQTNYRNFIRMQKGHSK